MPKGEASLSEQQDAPQETALAISLSYIYKVSLPAVPTQSRPIQQMGPVSACYRALQCAHPTAGTVWALSTDAAR